MSKAASESESFVPVAVVELQSLADVIWRLRAPGGCAWDRQQTHRSLRKYALEESAELVDAIDDEDDDAMREELGDVLLQIVLHAQLAHERGAFSLQDVVDGIRDKMLRRHPHVFDPTSTLTAEDVEAQWDALKRKEGRTTLGGIARSLAPLDRASELSVRAARVGFDFPSLGDALDKAHEEQRELEDALGSGDLAEAESELGDVLFAWINVGRHAGLDPRAALTRTSDKFARRFAFIESELARRGRTVDDASLEEMDALWDAAKANGD